MGHEFCRELDLFGGKIFFFASQACKWEQLERHMPSNFCLKQKSYLCHTLTLWKRWGSNGCFKPLGSDHLFFRTGKQTLSSISKLYAVYVRVEGLKRPGKFYKHAVCRIRTGWGLEVPWELSEVLSTLYRWRNWRKWTLSFLTFTAWFVSIHFIASI